MAEGECKVDCASGKENLQGPPPFAKSINKHVGGVLTSEYTSRLHSADYECPPVVVTLRQNAGTLKSWGSAQIAQLLVK